MVATAVGCTSKPNSAREFSCLIGADEDDEPVARILNQAIGETRVVATSIASSGADIMRVMPGFHVRMEGERVRYGDVIVLTQDKVIDKEKCLLVKNINTSKTKELETGMRTNPYVVDSQPVVGSEQDMSRLRVIPIANHMSSHMVRCHSLTPLRHYQTQKVCQ
eukprot:SAG11_NODE_5176_length_1640_cov_1.500973_2_plen_164_part_00